MRGIDSAKNAVPIGVVALRPQEQVARLHQFIGGLRAVAVNGRGGDTRGNTQHFFVQQVGFGIFAKEAAPRASAKEGKDFRASAELL